MDFVVVVVSGDRHIIQQVPEEEKRERETKALCKIAKVVSRREMHSPNKKERPTTPKKKLSAGESPVVDNFSANSPYKKPIIFMRKQLMRNHIEDVKKEEALKRLNINHGLVTRLVSEEEYHRLSVKSYKKKKHEIQKQIIVPRWPEVRKHIPGVDTWRPASPKPSDYKQGDWYYYASYGSDEDEGGDVYYDDNGNELYAPGGQFDEAQSMQDYGRLEAHANFSLYQEQGRSPAKFKSPQRSSNKKGNTSSSRNAIVHPTSPEGDDEDDDDVPTFDLTEEEIQAIIKIRSSLAKAIASLPDEEGANAKHVQKLPPLQLQVESENVGEETALAYFSPNSQQSRVVYQPPAQQYPLHYNPDQQAMFEYANGPYSNSDGQSFSPPSHTHESVKQSQHSQHPFRPTTPNKSPESIQSGTDSNKIFPEVRMSPLEMKYYREKQTTRPSSAKKSSNKPHPLIKGQYQTPQYQKPKAKVEASPEIEWRKSLESQFAANQGKSSSSSNLHKDKVNLHVEMGSPAAKKPIESPNSKALRKSLPSPKAASSSPNQKQSKTLTAEAPKPVDQAPQVTSSTTKSKVVEEKSKLEPPVLVITPVVIKDEKVNAALPAQDLPKQEPQMQTTPQPELQPQQQLQAQPQAQPQPQPQPQPENNSEHAEEESPRRTPNRASLRGSKIRQGSGSNLKCDIANVLASIKLDSSSNDPPQNEPHLEVEGVNSESPGDSKPPHPLFAKKADGSGGGMFNASMLNEMKQKKLKTVSKADKEKKEEVPERDEEKETIRYTQFRHNMLLHHISEFSTERFARNSLLGRGKYAAVYQSDIKQPVSIELSPDQDTAVFMKTIFRCLKQEDAETEDDLLLASLQERNAIKVAQFAGNDTAVAIKKPPPIATIEEFERELLALKSLTPHESIVGLQGYISHPFSIVMEFVPGRNLFAVLHDLKWQKNNSFVTRVTMVLDIVKGLKHMHNNQYMHRDIKPHNILIEESDDGEYIRAKIADLGTAIKLSYPASVKRNDNQKSGHRIVMLTDVVGTSGYTAPEVLHPDQEGYSYPADIYSLAIVMWEVLCQVNEESDFNNKLCNPLQGVDAVKAYGKLRTGLRPAIHVDYHSAHPTIHNTLISGWQTEAEYRMTFTEICENLEGLLEVLEE